MASNEQETLDLFGVSQEEMEKTEGIIPTLDVSQFLKDPQDSLEVTFVEDNPREIEFLDKQTGKQAKAKVITVECMDDEYTLWLSAVSLRTPIALMHKENNGLKGLTVRLKKVEGKHKKFGTVSYYRVSRVKNKETNVPK